MVDGEVNFKVSGEISGEVIRYVLFKRILLDLIEMTLI